MSLGHERFVSRSELGMPMAMSAQTFQQRTRHSSHRKVRCMVQGSGSRLTPFELGQIKVHAENGLGPNAIAELVHKEDGSKVSKEGVRQALLRLAAEPDWRGERREGSGRPRIGTAALDRQIRRALLQLRGEAKCTLLA